MLLLYVMYLGFFAFLLYTYSTPAKKKNYPWVKLCTSLLFVVIGVVSAVHSSRYDMLLLMLPALLLSAAGDVVLAFARIRERFSGKEMLAGILCFAAAHIFFYATFSLVFPPSVFDFLLPLLVVATIGSFIKGRRIRIGKMWLPALIYAYFVGLLAAKGVISVIQFGPSAGSILLLIGGMLFLVSDFLLFFMNFHTDPPKNLIYFNLSTYYLAAVLLASSLCFF